MNDEKLNSAINEFADIGFNLEDTKQDEQTSKWQIKCASMIPHEEIRFLWNPYILRGDVTIVAAAGGTGKTFALCGIAADISNGHRPLNELDAFAPAKTLFISAEDHGFVIAERMERAGADLDLVEILDASGSANLTLSDKYGNPCFEDFESILEQSKPDMVVLDPLHAFIGARVKMTEQSAIRPFMQGLASIAKKYNCAIVDVAHVSKKRAEDNANDAVLGATDIVNASRSVLRIINDETGQNPDRRVIVHTKANHSALGASVAFEIENGVLRWAGFSEVTKADMEDAARHGKSISEYLQGRAAMQKGQLFVADALETIAAAQAEKKRFYSYQTLQKYGINKQADIIPCIAELNQRGIIITFPENGRREQGRLLRGIELTRVNTDAQA